MNFTHNSTGAPHFPSGKFFANAAWTVIAALTHNLQENVKQWLTPSAEQQAEIARAQAAETAPTAPAGVVQLRTKTKNALRFQPAAASSGA